MSSVSVNYHVRHAGSRRRARASTHRGRNTSS